MKTFLETSKKSKKKSEVNSNNGTARTGRGNLEAEDRTR